MYSTALFRRIGLPAAALLLLSGMSCVDSPRRSIVDPEPQTGQIAVWTRDQGSLPISVQVGGRSGTVNAAFGDTPSCGQAGAFTTTLSPGDHSLTATSPTGSRWSGSVNITVGTCLRMELTTSSNGSGSTGGTGGTGGSGGSGGNVFSRMIFWHYQSNRNVRVTVGSETLGPIYNYYQSSGPVYPANRCGASQEPSSVGWSPTFGQQYPFMAGFRTLPGVKYSYTAVWNDGAKKTATFTAYNAGYCGTIQLR